MIESLTLITISTITYKLSRAIIPYLRSPYIPSIQKYIIINGCTDGIGKQYAKYMSNRNIPLILIGRNLCKLQTLNRQLQANYTNKNNNINTNSNTNIRLNTNTNMSNKLVQIDYSDNNLTLQKFNNIIQNLNLPKNSVSGIINCCGIACLQNFTQQSFQQIINIKKVNILSLQLCLKNLTNSCMMQNKPFLINISSYTAYYPLKYSAVYSASKAYVSNLLQAYQLQNKNVNVLSVQPWYVSTKMTGFRKGWDCVKPEQVVDGSMRLLGRRSRCTGSIKHQLIYQFGYLLQKLYFPIKIEQNYERVKKLLQIKAKRSNRKSKQSQNKNE